MTPNQAVNQLTATLKRALPFNWQGIIQAILSALSGNCFSPNNPPPTPASLRAACIHPTLVGERAINNSFRQHGVRGIQNIRQAKKALYDTVNAAPDEQLQGMIAYTANVAKKAQAEKIKKIAAAMKLDKSK